MEREGRMGEREQYLKKKMSWKRSKKKETLTMKKDKIC